MRTQADRLGYAAGPYQAVWPLVEYLKQQPGYGPEKKRAFVPE